MFRASFAVCRLLASLASLVRAVRARGLDRAWLVRATVSPTAALLPAVARRELAGRLIGAALPFDLCVDVLVRPTRISPRQSGAAGPCSTLASGVRGEARIVGHVLQSSSADRAESLGL
jgi:hypothetical protein